VAQIVGKVFYGDGTLGETLIGIKIENSLATILPFTNPIYTLRAEVIRVPLENVDCLIVGMNTMSKFKFWHFGHYFDG
jgi:hypothetical protein